MRMGVAPPLWRLACHEGGGGDVGQSRQRDLHEGYFDVEGLAGAFSVQQGGLDAVGTVEPRQHVHQGDADLHGAAFGLTRDGHPPALGLDDEVVACPAGSGDVRGEAAHRGQDELREFRVEPFPAQAEPVGGIGLEVLHQDIGLLQQVEEGRPARFGVKVAAAAPLAAVGTAEVGAVAGTVLGEGRSPAAGGVAARGLQFLHFGAKVRQELRGEGACEDAGQVHDPELGQGLRHAVAPAISLLHVRPGPGLRDRSRGPSPRFRKRRRCGGRRRGGWRRSLRGCGRGNPAAA